MYKKYFKENETESDVFVKEIKDGVEKILPGFGIFVKYTNNLIPIISISIRIGKDKSEWASGIAGNDPLSAMLFVENIGKNGELNNQLELKATQSRVFTKADSPYVVYGSQKIPFRKVKGDKKKILQAIVKYANSVKSILKKVKSDGLVHDYHRKIFDKKVK